MKSLAAIAAAVVLIPVAATTAESAVIYDYRGSEFTLCGTGCPENSPPNWDEDYLIASLTFDAPLAPNLTFADEVRTGLIAYTVGDKLGILFQTGTELPDNDEDDGIIPGLKLATDANGNITAWIMSTEPEGQGGTISANPPFVCPAEECGEELIIADYFAVDMGPGDDDWWDAISGTPGVWSVRAQVPEPATLALGLIALGGFAARQRRQFFGRK
jgi:hypothetical protein